ncbi:MAG: endonuclease [Saprospiraceae bacterium]|jgi:endonuclease I|nr:endonuclease [Saprospiraceae bacterium]MCA0333033.1 endonuclease [Bacteroidota bacterium]HMT78222.1 endonuclease [Saprospiraceae bacterium]HQU95258.1 endonuclease [Saprospiraceae bacterium]HQW97008.1 endonuclease [Saprospiraceae bacterium]
MRHLLFLLFFTPNILFSQHNPVFPSLSKDELLQAIKEGYTPANTLGYNTARDTLFRNILAVDNKLKCLYTDWEITLNPSLDPSDNAFSQNVNTEHIYPQSKGAKVEPARSNMYNLYPVRENVNTDRSNDPFGDIDDNQTQWWYYQDIKQSNKPSANIDLYSEKIGGKFEPKESRKGDIARSIMYFYTIYTSECNALDPNYFVSMSNDLCKWHFLDPVDQDEWNRNILIASYQDQKSNPFILDCTIPERSYCSDLGYKCVPSNSLNSHIDYKPLTIMPNIGTNGTVIHINAKEEESTIIVMDSQGSQVACFKTTMNNSFSLDSIPTGVYFIFSKNKEGYITGSGRYIKL